MLYNDVVYNSSWMNLVFVFTFDYDLVRFQSIQNRCVSQRLMDVRSAFFQSELLFLVLDNIE